MGTGHVMRSLALAEGAMTLGHDCLLVGSVGNVSWLHGYLESTGIAYVKNP